MGTRFVKVQQWRRAARTAARAAGFAAAGCMLSGCSARMAGTHSDVSSGVPTYAPDDPVPKGGGRYRVGAAYTVGGRTFVPAENKTYAEEGLASWYGEDFHGHQTANGETFDMNSVSAAHATLPMPTYARVTNMENNRSVIVRVNDRGPYRPDRIIDVSVKTAILLGFYTNGVARVRVEYVGNAPLEGSNDGTLIATLRQGQPAPPPVLVSAASLRNLVTRDGRVPLPPERRAVSAPGEPASYLPASIRSGTGQGLPPSSVSRIN